MRVLFINTVFGRGSTGNIVRALGEALEQQGHEYKALYGRPPVSDDPHAVYIGSAWDTYVHAALSRLTDRSGFYSKRATAQAIRFIREYAPDIIHLHNLHGYYLNVEMLFDYLKTEYTGKVVWTLHDCWAYTGHCTYYTYAGCGRWKTACHHCPQKAAYPSSLLLDSSERNYKEKKTFFTSAKGLTVITVSDWLKDETRQSFLSKYPIERIYNGVDRTIFKPTNSLIREKLGIGDKYMILGVSDGWSKRKGLSHFLRLADELSSDEIIVLVGLKKEEIERLPSGIIGLERTNSVRELVELYSAADIFVNPSVEETFGLVTVEALACGTPTIVFNATACPELVDETCGRVIPKEDYNALKQAIQELRTVKLTQEDCVKRSALFDKAINHHQYIDLYHSVLEGERCYE